MTCFCTWKVESMVNIKMILDTANLANAHKLQLDKIKYSNILFKIFITGTLMYQIKSMIQMIEEHERTNASLYDLSKF